MSTVITVINETDLITNAPAVLNSNFSSLNTNKIETSVIDTDPSLTADSDSNIPSQKAVKTYVDAGGNAANLQRLLPTGTMLSYAAAVAPSFFLLCDGSAVSRSTYSALFAIIGTSYGAGNGSTTFNLPDTRGRTMIGAGIGTKVATFVSRASNVLTVSGLTSNPNNEFQTGEQVLYNTTVGVMTGLTNNTTYYLIRLSNTTFSLASTLALAQAGTAIALSSDGSGTQTFTLTLTTRTVGDVGGEENHAISSTESLAHTHTMPSSLPSGSGAGTGTLSGSGSAGSNLVSSFGGNAAMNNMQPFFVGSWIIKT